ncbi:arginine N-succinyltransferase [Kangiella sediminilitoris]|uniref:Arginine N-succinyltransferase n=1 Tax=Kangiella sediminilitoris TaxID=1144748 RepID=A0A1B3B9B6_9GAMM|nr:arginine N-succinyltransferase [Kangiella sediminilitoris]AOE49393.1 arginine succinyltransferase [Kangiella sediminilitoris]
MVIRPAQSTDLEDILELAASAGTGLTTLPHNPETISNRITNSQQALSEDIKQPGSECYFFVLEDSQDGKVIGTSALVSAVGMDDAFFSYKLSTQVSTSPELGVYNPHQMLVLGNDYTGATEIATLFLAEEYRGGINGHLLSKSRFLFLADHPERFSEKVIAEMRGYSDDNGYSPFWEAIGKRFFKMEFAKADAVRGLGSNTFISELMPKYPIYVDMLPEEARAVIGRVHADTAPALSLLKKEGFTHQNYVDVFDGGPTVEVQRNAIRTIAQSHIVELVAGEVSGSTLPIMISNRKLKDYRCIVEQSRLEGDQLTLPQASIDALGLNEGDTVRAVELFNKRRPSSSKKTQ